MSPAPQCLPSLGCLGWPLLRGVGVMGQEDLVQTFRPVTGPPPSHIPPTQALPTCAQLPGPTPGSCRQHLSLLTPHLHLPPQSLSGPQGALCPSSQAGQARALCPPQGLPPCLAGELSAQSCSMDCLPSLPLRAQRPGQGKQLWAGGHTEIGEEGGYPSQKPSLYIHSRHIF